MFTTRDLTSEERRKEGIGERFSACQHFSEISIAASIFMIPTLISNEKGRKPFRFRAKVEHSKPLLSNCLVLTCNSLSSSADTPIAALLLTALGRCQVSLDGTPRDSHAQSIAVLSLQSLQNARKALSKSLFVAIRKAARVYIT